MNAPTSLNAARKRREGNSPSHGHCATCGDLNILCRLRGCLEELSQPPLRSHIKPW